MIVLKIKLNNILAFNDFEVNFSYPRKLSKSLIEGEHLKNIPSFRYKKLIVLIGSNATGKTSLIKAIWRTALFLSKKDEKYLDSLFNHIDSETSQIELDFVNEFDDSSILYRAKIRITHGGSPTERKIEVALHSKKLVNGDAYETCVRKFDRHSYVFENWNDALKDFPPNFGWRVSLPSTEEYFDRVLIQETSNPSEANDYYNILNSVMQTLDPSIIEITKSQDADNAIVVKHNKRQPILIQNENKLSGIPFLSSGTKHGIEISNTIYAIKHHENGLYMVDELFSYVTSDIEAAILSTMTSLLSNGEQLIFSTHNSDILDLRFPFHSFYFMKKHVFDEEAEITITCASELENRNNVSLKNMFDNDAFASAPNVERIYSLGDRKNGQE